MTEQRATFILEGHEHTIGDDHCDACYFDYPHRCTCGGLIHGDSGVDAGNYVWDVWQCDQCGLPADRP